MTLVILLSVLSLLISGAYWLGTTTSGLQWLLTTVSRVSGNTLAFTGISGNLSSLRIGLIRYQDDDSIATVKNLAVDWRPSKLLSTTLLIETLTADTIEFSSSPSDDPPSLPDTLQFPISIVIDRLGIRSLRTYSSGSDTPDFSAQQIALRMTSHDGLHQFPIFSLTLEQGKLAGRLQIATQTPFDLSGRVVFHAWPAALALDYPASSLIALHLDGNLEQTNAALTIQAGKLQGKATLVLHPFATQPLSRLHLVLNNLNPRHWSADLPVANLNLAGELQQASPNRLQGNLLIRNAEHRPVDQDGLPLREARMRLALTEEVLILDEIAVQLGQSRQAGANLTGKVQWHISDAAGFASLRLHQINPAMLDTRLQPASLSGKLELQGDQAAQRGSLKLHDKALQIALDTTLSRRDHNIAIETLDFSHGNARISGHGHLQLDANQPFTFEGIVKQFDLSALIDAPRSDLNASFKLDGQLMPQPAGNFDYTITRSHYNHQPVMGKGVITLDTNDKGALRQLTADAELRLGDNLLQAKGRLGKTGDRLQLILSAPKLAQTGLPLQGDVTARFAFDGKLERPDITFEANATQFNYRNEHQLASLQVKGNWQGEAIALDLQTGEYRAGARSHLQKLALMLTGTEFQHRLTLNADLDQTRQVQFNTSGGRVRNSAAFQWRGTIDQFTLTGPIPLRLATQPAVTLSAKQFTLGHTRLAVASGSIDIQKTSWTPENWATEGTFDRIRLPTDTATAQTSEPLTVSGGWQLAASRQLNGYIHLRRTGGDWVLPLETPFALGLQTLSLELLAEGNNINGQLVVEGTHIGTTRASARLPLQRTDNAWQIQTDALISGNLQFNLPDLSWIGPAIGDNFLSSGKLTGNANLAGTFDTPHLQGEIQGQALMLALLDEGLQLQDGKLKAHFDQDNLVLDTLSFSAPLEKPSSDRLLRGLKLTRQSGQIDLGGNLDLRRQLGELRVAFDHLPLIQQPDRWIVVSGNNRIDFKERTVAVTGKILTEIGFLKQPAAGRPSLGDDVVIVSDDESVQKSPALAINVEATLDLGERFYLRASGLEGRLAGQLRLRSRPGQPLSAIGSIATRDTQFEAYGQKLLVRRGIVNFDGPLDNPGLNILAVRSNQPPEVSVGQAEILDQPHQDSALNALAARSGLRIEAGVEVTGTVRNPKIRLVSQPNVPDSEKLSWLVLGRAPDAGGLDSGLLLSAASSILGGQSDESMLDKITQGLGFDDFSIRQREGSSSLADQIGTVGKRLSNRAYLSYERGLTNASTGVAKLNYALFPNITLVTRAGEDSSVDLFYNFRFD